jgi:hypothetical protein
MQGSSTEMRIKLITGGTLRGSVLLTATLLAALATACAEGPHSTQPSGAGEVSPAPTATAIATATVAGCHALGGFPCPGGPTATPAHPFPTATVGAPISATDATYRLPLTATEGFVHSPVAATGDVIILAEEPFPVGENQFFESFSLWNPATGATTPLWKTPAGQADDVWDVSGPWLATVRTGLELPFPEWHLILRNVSTGETREIAKSDPAIMGVQGLNPGLPTGFAPSPSMSGTRVVWAEYHLDSDGSVQKRIQLYDIGDARESTIESVPALAEDVSQPSLAGDKIAWIHRPSSETAELVVKHLDTGKTSTVPVDNTVYSCALTADGRYLAWDENYVAKYALDLNTARAVRYAGSEGWGTNRDGNLLSWQPATQVGSADKGGYYDTTTGVVHFVQPLHPDSVITEASAIGSWFTWQDRSPAGDYYYFVKLPGR